MDISGEFSIPATREQVWEALNDAGVLSRCIPGCESMEQASATEFAARVRAAIGPVKARFDTRMELSNLDPPRGYRLSGGGSGGSAGFSQGEVDVTLDEGEDGHTVLRYEARLKVGGKLAQIGSRLVVGATRKVAREFFERFAVELAGAGEAEPSG